MTLRATPLALAATLALALALSGWTAGASAAAPTQNACNYSFDGLYRNQLVALTAKASQADGSVSLTGASLSATLPTFIPQAAYELGVLKKGRNSIPSRVWIAVAGSNVTPASQVFALTVTASTTIKTKPNGIFVSATPIVVRIQIPASTWTSAGADATAFAQAGPGTLPKLPVGVRDAMATVKGSIVVAPKLAALRFVMDCQPGKSAPDGRSLKPKTAPAFASLPAS